MFSYCQNNPVMFCDNLGNRPVLNTGKEETLEEYEYSIEQMQKDPVTFWKKKGVTIELVTEGGETTVKINNSYLITNHSDLVKYVKYVMRKSEYKDFFIGTVDGFVYEWEVHNLAYELSTFFGAEKYINQARSVNVGPTIYDDRHGIATDIMTSTYKLLYPASAKQDRRALLIRGIKECYNLK